MFIGFLMTGRHDSDHVFFSPELDKFVEQLIIVLNKTRKNWCLEEVDSMEELEEKLRACVSIFDVEEYMRTCVIVARVAEVPNTGTFALDMNSV